MHRYRTNVLQAITLLKDKLLRFKCRVFIRQRNKMKQLLPFCTGHRGDQFAVAWETSHYSYLQSGMPVLFTWCLTAVLHTRPLHTEAQAASNSSYWRGHSFLCHCTAHHQSFLISFRWLHLASESRAVTLQAWRRKAAAGKGAVGIKRLLSVTISLQAEYVLSPAAIQESRLLCPWWKPNYSLRSWRVCYATWKCHHGSSNISDFHTQFSYEAVTFLITFQWCFSDV
jgi:hypothetical protein